MLDCVDLTRHLVGFDTINPPGDEDSCAQFLGSVLERNGVAFEIVAFGPKRANVIARLEGLNERLAPLVLTGHLDTVPLGTVPWSQSPFAGEIAKGRLYGRGSSDMKSGVAAMTVAFVRAAEQGQLERGVTLLLTGGEEVGCQGAMHLREHESQRLRTASAMLVGEPTGNELVAGHKGALFLRARTHGVTAHSSMPGRGVNAIYKAARAVTQIEQLGMPNSADRLIGQPTINVGMIAGGLNANSVPDRAEFTIDVRSGPELSHPALLQDLRTRLGPEVSLEPFIDMPPVFTAERDPFTDTVAEAARAVLTERARIAETALPFFSDASVFQPHYRCPTIILGPGELSTAHQTDEYCIVEKIREAEEIYFKVIGSWCGAQRS